MSAFEELQLLPNKLRGYHPKCLIYPPNSSEIIISTDQREYNGGIFKYNLITNTVQCIHNYDTNSPSRHGHFIGNDKLFIYAGFGKRFFVYDLKTNTNITSNYTNTALCDIKDCDLYSKAVNVSSNGVVKIHILTRRNHLIYNCNNGTIIKGIIQKMQSYPKLIYSESAKQLLSLGSDKSDEIFTCDINQKLDQTQYVCKLKEKLQMPHTIGDENILKNIFKNINIIISFRNT
eukprot:501089_1